MMIENASVTKSATGLQIEFTKNEPVIIVLEATLREQSDYITQKFDSAGKQEIAFPSDVFRDGEVKGYVFPLAKDLIDSEVAWDWIKTNIYQPLTGFSNGVVPPMGDWVIGKAVKKAKNKYLALKAKNKKKKKVKTKAKRSRGGMNGFPDPAPGGTSGPSVY